MKKILYLVLVVGAATSAFAGNPDRRGESGANELVMNGWARSTGMWGMNSARVRGIEAERINPAGLAFVRKTDIQIAYSLWMQGSGLGVIQAGIAQQVKRNVFSLHVQALNFGQIIRTTVENPQGGIGTYTPRFINIGLTYARVFSRSIYGGVTVRLINEGIDNINAFGFSVDAGLQYVTGKKKNIHFGVALRNVGTPMTFRGDGFSFQGNAESGNYQLAFDRKSQKFDLPVQLNIGAAYDLLLGDKVVLAPGEETQNYRVTFAANFTSNAFGNDYYGGGIEFSYRDIFMLRGGYRGEAGIGKASTRQSAYTGFSAGMTVEAPFKKDGTGPRLGLDYSFRSTDPYMGTHSLGLHFNLGGKDKEEKGEIPSAKAAYDEDKSSKKETKKKASSRKSKDEIQAEADAKVDSINKVNAQLLLELEAAKNKPADTIVKVKQVEVIKIDTLFFGAKSHIEEVDGKKIEVFDDYDNLEFETGASTVKPSSYQYLDYLVAKLRKHPDAIIRLSGHTDNVGARDKNVKLSQDRVTAVKQYFISKGIDDFRIKTEAFGPDKPKVPNTTAANRQTNRRVEIFLEH
ncbi:MAG: OmpA family protein [Chitinophagales bacterium]|nr:OmpA family protein [Chitinophagales bacterium]